MTDARKAAWEIHATLFGYAPGENLCDTKTMDFLTAAIEQDRREVIERCAAKVDSMASVLPAFCARSAAFAIRSLSPKEATTAKKVSRG